MSAIQNIRAREILDSRGIPALEVDLVLENGLVGSASVPSGTSTGQFEAVEKRDNDQKRYHGKGLLSAIETIYRDIAPALLGHSVFEQRAIDDLLIELDGTANKSKLGANVTLALSLAATRAAANAMSIPVFQYLGGIKALRMPTIFANILNGGAHADNNLDVQEFMIVPHGGSSFAEEVRAISEVYHTLKGLLESQKLSTSVGAEGGFAPSLKSHEQALDLLCQAIEKSGYTLGDDFSLALDVAASEFYQNGVYSFEGKKIKAPELTAIYEKWVKKYPILSIEDGMGDSDEQGWAGLTEALGDDVDLVGDDVFVTSEKRLLELSQKGIANSILIKPNQVGTLSETFNTMALAEDLGYGAMVSHRSGETEDSFIADLAVGSGCGHIKCGAPARGERTAKYNQLLRIAEDLGR